MLWECQGVCRVFSCVRHGSSLAERWRSVRPWPPAVLCVAVDNGDGTQEVDIKKYAKAGPPIVCPCQLCARASCGRVPASRASV
jgi:hypothetical protein